MLLKQIIVSFFLLLFFSMTTANAQSITGTWKGQIPDDNEYLEINVVQIGDKLCGYTGDYELADPESFCKAYFTGVYIPAKNQYFFDGTDFIVNSGTHVLIQLLVTVSKENGKLMMKGFCRLKPTFGRSAGSPSAIILYKTSPAPTVMTETMRNCVRDNTPKKPVTKPLPVKPVVPGPAPKPVTRPVSPKPNLPKPPPPVKDTAVRHMQIPQRDTVKRVTVTPVPIINTAPVKTAGRINKEIRTITVHQKKITLYVYDNAEVDGDSISVFYNGRLLMSHIRLTEKPVKVEFILDESIALHSLVIFAENLGSIPPNTALIIFTDDQGKRYELFSKADLGVNAELLFKYEP